VIREWIAEGAARRGAAPYLEDAQGAGSLTYAELRRSVRVWERRLDEAGVPPGAGVAVCLADPVGYAAALTGILAAGRVAVPLDSAAPAAEHARVLSVARPAVIADDSPHGLRPAAWPAAWPAPSGGIFLCTSGTTGTPKGILLREDQLTHVATQVAAQHRLTPADRGYCCLPLFHVNAEVVGLLATLSTGACLVLDRKFSRGKFWDLIDERGITWINAVPAIITVLALDPPAARPPAGVRFVRSASAPLAPSTLRRFEEAFGIAVIETYGMTEAASMITANPLDGPRKPGSAGRPAGTEVQVTGPAGPGQARDVGRVRIRGAGVITEYASGGRPGVIDADGWLDTGDVGYLDEDGYLFLVGRSDDVINRGGEKIYPREVEDFLLAQPGVQAAAVVAAPDEVLGERPVAYIVPSRTAGHELTDALDAACLAALPRHKRPTAIFLLDALPLGPTGKIARRQLLSR